MIKLFRNIRQNLIIENKTGKYLKYAIGEIVLVVIGILIALQINNWNEERKRLRQENTILLSLKFDFLESKNRLQETMKQQKVSINRCIALIEMFEGKRPIAPNDTIKKFLTFGAYTWFREELVTGAYDALINAGDSELIKNDELTRDMAEFFSIAKSDFEDQESSMNALYNMKKIAETTLIPLAYSEIRNRIGLDTIRNPYEAESIKFLFKQDAFFGHLFEKTGLEYLRYSIQQDLLFRIEQILTILSEEIKDEE
ncbi:MAG TPA: DUF6090 family protein [Yeosuana sp.]